MATREEIREGVAKELARQDDELIWGHIKAESQAVFLFEANQILSYLHSQGVAIKVERELPEPGYMVAPGWKKVGWHSACKYMKRTGWEATEPLIEEG